MPPEAVTAPTETPTAPLSPVDAAIASGDQAAFKEARRQTRQPHPLPVITQAPPTSAPHLEPDALETSADPAAEVTAEQEADSGKPDAELSDAGRTLRKTRADARKAQIQSEISELIKLRNALRAEVQPAAPSPPQPSAPPAASSPAFPTFDQWAQQHPDQSYEGYIQAAIAHGIDSRLAAERAAVQQQQIAQTYQDRVAAYAKEHPDFDEAIAAASDVRLWMPATDALKRHELGPHIAHHLATHRDVAAQVEQLEPADQLLALGEIAATLRRPAAPAPRKVTTSAPRPPLTLGTKAADPGDDLDSAVASGDVARFREVRRQRMAAQLTGR